MKLIINFFRALTGNDFEIDGGWLVYDPNFDTWLWHKEKPR